MLAHVEIAEEIDLRVTNTLLSCPKIPLGRNWVGGQFFFLRLSGGLTNRPPVRFIDAGEIYSGHGWQPTI